MGISGPVERLRPARIRGFVPGAVAAARALCRHDDKVPGTVKPATGK